MAKTKLVIKKVSGGKAKKGKSKKTMASRMPEDSTRIYRHVNMLVDPCNAELGPTAYRGADGIVSRFRSSVSLTGGTATQTSFVYVFYPAYNAIGSVQNIPATLYTFAATTAGPGQAFLLASADSQRCVAGCVSMHYSGTELDRCGTIYSGVIPISALSAPGASISNIAALLQHESRPGDQPVEVKWSPTSIEEEYWNTGAITPDGSGDRNAIVIVGVGLNPLTTSANFNFVNTLVAEWRPAPASGLGTPNPSSHDVPGGIEKVRSVLAKMGPWWYSAAKSAYNIATSPVAKTIATAIGTVLL